jgi:hypothetical protein
MTFSPPVECSIFLFLGGLISTYEDITLGRKKQTRRTSHDKNKLTYPPELALPVSVEVYGGPEFA